MPIYPEPASGGGSGSVATDAIWDAKGDVAVGTGADTAARLAVGVDGTVPVALASETTGLLFDNPTSRRDKFFLPTGSLTDTMSRQAATAATIAAVASGTIRMVAIPMRKGMTVSSISFVSGTTAAGTPTHQRFGLYDSARAKLAESADDTSTAWAANAVKTLTMGTPYLVTASGLYYLAALVVATTVPTMTGVVAGSANALGLAPILHGTSDTGLDGTAVLPSTAAAITATAASIYGYVS